MIEKIIYVRYGGIQQIVDANQSPEDVLFTVLNGKLSVNLVPYIPAQGKGYRPSMKNDLRKMVVEKILAGEILPDTNSLDKIYFCSFEPLMNVDYCFEITPKTSECNLYIAKEGKVIRKYQPYNANYDERADIANICSINTSDESTNGLWSKIKKVFS